MHHYFMLNLEYGNLFHELNCSMEEYPQPRCLLHLNTFLMRRGLKPSLLLSHENNLAAMDCFHPPTPKWQ